MDRSFACAWIAADPTSPDEPFRSRRIYALSWRTVGSGVGATAWRSYTVDALVRLDDPRAGCERLASGAFAWTSTAAASPQVALRFRVTTRAGRPGSEFALRARASTP
jgi:hypothetical protein